MILNEKRIHYKLVALDQMIFLDMMLKEEHLCPSIKVILIEKSYIFHINFIFIQVHEKDYLFLRLVPLPSFETTAGTATDAVPTACSSALYRRSNDINSYHYYCRFKW
jgi:hypothetical protein